MGKAVRHRDNTLAEIDLADQPMSFRKLGLLTGKPPVYFRKLVDYGRLTAVKEDGHFWSVTPRAFCEYVKTCRQRKLLMRELREDFVKEFSSLML